MYTLLEHQPVIDVPYEKINDIAVALVKEGYGKVSEYETEREMLGSKIKVLEQRLNNKYIEIDNLNRDYRNSFERLKAQEREIEDLKDEIIYLERKIAIRDNALKDRDKAIEMLEGKQDTIVKQAKIDVLNKVKERAVGLATIETYHICNLIDELIKEVENEQKD